MAGRRDFRLFESVKLRTTLLRRDERRLDVCKTVQSCSLTSIILTNLAGLRTSDEGDGKCST
jgi:hypothetical protein